MRIGNNSVAAGRQGQIPLPGFQSTATIAGTQEKTAQRASIALRR